VLRFDITVFTSCTNSFNVSQEYGIAFEGGGETSSTVSSNGGNGVGVGVEVGVGVNVYGSKVESIKTAAGGDCGKI